jgi:hypothetical protein
MIERRILLQETTTGLRIVPAESACAGCPGACLGTSAATNNYHPQSANVKVAISSSALNGLVLRLFALPLAVLIALVAGLDAVTNAYPMLQVLPLQLGILALLAALMALRSLALKSNLIGIDQTLKRLSFGPTMPKVDGTGRLQMTIDEHTVLTKKLS